MENINFVRNEEMLAYINTVKQFRLPRWEQLPTIGLYMDQVVTVIESTLETLMGFSGEAFITSSMVNNYVKLGMIAKPEKKKYSREHIAGLLIITLLKQSLAIGDARLGMDTVLSRNEPSEAYDSFCDYLERALCTVADSVLAAESATRIDLTGDPLILMATCSFATKLFSAKMLSLVKNQPSDSSTGRLSQ